MNADKKVFSIGVPLRLSAAGILCFALFLSGCSRYSDFSLPVLNGGNSNYSFQFEEHGGPVLERGSAGDVLNPSIVGRDMYYSEWDGRTWHTAQARSEDGIAWTKTRRVLSPDPQTWEGSYIAANGSALAVGNSVWYWFVAGDRKRPRIGLARDWRKEARPVLETGPYMSWDEYGVADPYAIRVGDFYYLYFLGEDRASRQRIGVARSRDGIQWEKLRTNPVLEVGGPGAFDESGLGEPAVWTAGGSYWMLYTGRAADETRRLGLARSTDGVRWTKLPAVFSGAQAWDAKVLCDPTVDASSGAETRVYFGGGDVARPDENLNGQIGMGVLRMVAK
jgi:hypothetical protein